MIHALTIAIFKQKDTIEMKILHLKQEKSQTFISAKGK